MRKSARKRMSWAGGESTACGCGQRPRRPTMWAMNVEETGSRSAAPGPWAKVISVAAILGAGACGGLIGYALVDISCEGDCSTQLGLGALTGSVICAVGVAIVVALTLRALVVRPTATGRAFFRFTRQSAPGGPAPEGLPPSAGAASVDAR